MPDAPPRLVVRHVALGAAARGAGVAAGAARLAFLPLRPLARGAAAVLPVRRYAMALARSGSEVERQLLGRGDRLARDVVGSRVADELVDRLAASDRVSALAARALGGPLTDRIAATVVERALTSAATEALISRTLERPELERLIVLALDSPATDRIVCRVLAAPGVELAVTRVLESELLDATTARFLESDEIERVIDRIAHGPELRAAVAAQSAGLADLVAGEIRGRSAAADETAERLAQSLIPRRWRHGPPAGAAGT
jgi:hypothetical protein